MNLTMCYDNNWKKKKKKEFGATEAEESDIEQQDKINVPATGFCMTATELLCSVTDYQNQSDTLQLERVQ